ncbi:MAG: hypothetical protein RL220_1658 [Bacteroidota bacterium]
MIVSIIAAMGSNREIGANNDLLWHLPADMDFFKRTTLDHHVIMGRRNYDSIPERFRPLPHRTNVIITRDPELQAPECYVCTTLEEALAICGENGETEAFVIGGGQIYDLSLRLGLVDRMYLTHVQGSFPDADTFFPQFDVNEWDVTELFAQDVNPANAFPFVVRQYDRKK